MLYSKEFILENKTKVMVSFDLYEERNNLRWYIQDILYKKPRQRDWRSLHSSFRDDFEYRELSLEDRGKYRFERYKEFCGEEILKAAYQDIYDRIKPDILN